MREKWNQWQKKISERIRESAIEKVKDKPDGSWRVLKGITNIIKDENVPASYVYNLIANNLCAIFFIDDTMFLI